MPVCPHCHTEATDDSVNWRLDETEVLVVSCPVCDAVLGISTV